MRPVARIAQSVEQGIENPRVLGSIPSPGTTIQRTQPMAGFLLFYDRTHHQTPFDYSPLAAHPYGASATRALFNASGVSPSPGTTIQRTQPMAGFLLFYDRTLHRTPFDYSPQAAHPYGASATRAPFNAFGVSPSPGTTIMKGLRFATASVFLILNVLWVETKRRKISR